MRPLLESDALAANLRRLAPYVSTALANAARFARRLHAEELTLEHLLCALLADEESALTQLVLFAFADPETIGHEITALAPGILVVTSERCVPFSPRAIGVLEGAREEACAREHAEVSPSHIAIRSVGALEPQIQRALTDAGWTPDGILAGDAFPPGALPPSGPLFRHYSKDARRALATSARVAHGLGRETISPGHLLLAALEAEGGLRERCGLTASRARMVLSGRDADPTPPSDAPISPDEALTSLLGGLPDGAGSEALLSWVLEQGPVELRGLFERQKVGSELLSRARGAFRDPEPPAPVQPGS